MPCYWVWWFMSLLSWERGLKYKMTIVMHDTEVVAPLVGAWIEIAFAIYLGQYTASLLSWERGLKFLPASISFWKIWSLLSWERGLKYLFLAFISISNCRSSRGSVD